VEDKGRGKRKKRAGQSGKSVEQLVGFTLNHKTRVRILTVLYEGTFTVKQIAETIEEPLSNVSNHVKEMLDGGSIEIAKTEIVRNAVQHWYRAVKMPYYSEEDVAAMPPGQRQVTAGLTIQSMAAEMVAGLWAGKMMHDPRMCLAWKWFNVDQQGRREIADELERSWGRIEEIEAEATDRRARSGEEAVSMVVALTGFERARKGPALPHSADDE
jgi:DNA-binding transcriptional ArsR family regulator